MEQEAFEAFRKKFADAIRDDLNTSMALTIVYDVVKADISEKTKLALLNDFDQVLALNLTTAGRERLDAGTSVDAELEQFINEKDCGACRGKERKILPVQMQSATSFLHGASPSKIPAKVSYGSAMHE